MIADLEASNRSDNDGPMGKRFFALRSRCNLVPAGSGRLRNQPTCRNGGASPSVHRDNRAIHFRFAETPSWMTPRGVWMKRKAIERKGLPDMAGCRFITLTLDPEKFDFDPLTAYLKGKDKLRKWMFACREAGLWDESAWWCWKLEFTAQGWAHWHLVIDRKKKFSVYEMEKIGSLWGLGRTNCRRISKSSFGYQFKYAFKGVYQDDDSGLSLPQWFLDWQGVKTVRVDWTDQDGNEHSERVAKPVTFARVRFWQTSKGFYTEEQPQREKTNKQPESGIFPHIVRAIYYSRSQTVRVIARDRSGKYLRSKSVRIEGGFSAFYRMHEWSADHKRSFTLSSSSFLVDSYTANKTTNKNDIWILQQIQAENLLTLRKASQIRRSMRNLHRC